MASETKTKAKTKLRKRGSSLLVAKKQEISKNKKQGRKGSLDTVIKRKKSTGRDSLLSPKIRRKKSKSKKHSRPKLWRNISKGDLPETKKTIASLIKKNKDPDKNPLDDILANNLCALALASKLGKRRICKALLDHKADPNRWNSDATPLMYAIVHVHLATLKILLLYGSNPYILAADVQSANGISTKFRNKNCIEISRMNLKAMRKQKATGKKAKKKLKQMRKINNLIQDYTSGQMLIAAAYNPQNGRWAPSEGDKHHGSTGSAGSGIFSLFSSTSGKVVLPRRLGPRKKEESTTPRYARFERNGRRCDDSSGNDDDDDRKAIAGTAIVDSRSRNRIIKRVALQKKLNSEAQKNQPGEHDHKTICDKHKQGNTLTVVQYNIWFSDREAKKRIEAVGKIVAECDADIVALEEVRPNVLVDYILPQKVFKNYYISDSTGATLGRYGVLLLSKQPLEKLRITKLPSRLNRSTTVACVNIPFVTSCECDGYTAGAVTTSTRNVIIAAAHLESYPQDEQWRHHQLRVMMRLLNRYTADDYFMLMDSNIRGANEDAHVTGPAHKFCGGYVDSWVACKTSGKVITHCVDAEHGYTRDSSRNPMVRKEEQLRLDRVYVKTNDWKPTEFELLGTSPIEGTSDLRPSDHFGVRVKLHLSETALNTAQTT
eukprot:TRINITY_DN6030_c0_g1_i1.p1 TRINITY_DN6030_c0_g1~~TRINITY_DN6030_c0_g1_i1.p1  ORF type:complete len:684 (-),score=111.07 TRINITY_DN6030_c0_g1_i1:154-2133(-)